MTPRSRLDGLTGRGTWGAVVGGEGVRNSVGSKGGLLDRPLPLPWEGVAMDAAR
jgi:hypothetical protein